MRTPRCKIAVAQRDDGGNLIRMARCEETGIYRTEFTDCASCRKHLGVLWCVGHWVCIDHAASCRADSYKFIDEPVDVTVGRMRADYAKGGQ